MADISDKASEIIDGASDRAVQQACRQAAAMPEGKPGDCGLCGEWSGPRMRTLDEIVAAVRSNENYTEDELVYSVVAFDVLLAQLALDQDATRLQHWMSAATQSPKDYAGEANDPANPEAANWYRAMHGVQPEACNCGQVPTYIECPYHSGEDE